MNFKSYLSNHRGEAARIARAEGVAPISVWEWADKQVPAKRVLSIWLLTDGEVTPHEMRPDLYPPGVVEFCRRALLSRIFHRKNKSADSPPAPPEPDEETPEPTS